MKKLSIVSALAGLALLGPSLAAADCPAFLNAEEGVPCIVAKVQESAVDNSIPKQSSKSMIDPTRDRELRANIDAWKYMVQNDK